MYAVSRLMLFLSPVLGMVAMERTVLGGPRVRVTGSDAWVWVVAAGEQQEGLGEIRMWMAGPRQKDRDAPPGTSRFLPPIRGEIIRLGADSDALRILFSNNATWNYFGHRKAQAGIVWSDHCRRVPLAWGGDASQANLWTLVATDALLPLAPPTTSPASERTPDTEEGGEPREDEAVEGADGSLTLLSLREGRLSRVPVTPEAEGGAFYLVTGREGVASLLWLQSDGEVRCSHLQDGTWSPPEMVVRSQGIATGWAGATEEGLAFIAGRSVTDDTVFLDVYLRRGDGWSSTGTVREGNDYLEVRLETGGVGVARGRLGIARANDANEVEFGWVDLDASPVVTFATLKKEAETSQPEEMDWTDTAITMVMVALLTYALYTRREQVTRPAAIPQGTALAPTWKRVVATLIDLAPAVFFTFVVASVVMRSELQAFMEAMDDPESGVADDVMPYRIKIGCTLSYGLWCLAWELATGTTLGKKLFECRVLSSDGAAPERRQILIRNVLRVIVLFLAPQGLMVSLMMMLMFTRNCQHVGDLLANTIVVQPAGHSGPPVARPGDPDRE